MKPAVCLILLLTLALPATSATYYVALTGSNQNSGTTPQSPWRTLQYALSLPAPTGPGDTICLLEGNYLSDGSVTPEFSGTPDQVITVRPYGDAVVQISRFRFENNINYYRLHGLRLEYSDDSGIIIHSNHAENFLQVDSCHISYHDCNGIYAYGLPGSNLGSFTVEACTLRYNGQDETCGDRGTAIAIFTTRSRAFIRRNYIAHNEAKGISWSGSSPQYGSGTVVEYNTILDNKESGMDLAWIDSSVIRYNLLLDNGRRDDEGGGEYGDKGIQVFSGATHDTIRHNLIRSSGHYEFVPSAGPNYWYNNTFVRDAQSTFWWPMPQNVVDAAGILFSSITYSGGEFVNNIIVNFLSQTNKRYCLEISEWDDYDRQVWHHNLYYTVNDAGEAMPRAFKIYDPAQLATLHELIQVGHERGSRWGNPKFTMDFHLQSDSPARDAGYDLGYAYKGKAPDMGCFEFDEDYSQDRTLDQEIEPQPRQGESASQPDERFLLNYPNPFNPVTTVRYHLDQSGPVDLAVYDVSGREMARLVSGWREAGHHEVRFDASRLASGLYVSRLNAEGRTYMTKMMLVK
ncbi:MAG: T9SS C-terminal target domain-containing protein [Candidatus Zixiibacteriota bacterium]|nr:MAG: T9SS C-terminal target domain-containing protein [candidate division Zixibacteria bacterium]